MREGAPAPAPARSAPKPDVDDRDDSVEGWWRRHPEGGAASWQRYEWLKDWLAKPAPTTIVIDKVQYICDAEGRLDTAQNMQYIGVMTRKSDGKRCLSFRRSGSSKAYNVELNSVFSITMGARQWNRPDNFRSNEWMERAVDLRSFIEANDGVRP